MSKTHRYEGERIVVVFDPGRCVHSEECIRGLPEVFDTGRRRWVDPSGAVPAKVAEVVMRCPTGALRFERPDGGAEEPVPSRNMVTVAPNGPLHVRGDLEIETPEGVAYETRAALCRCGASKNKPYCDGSHEETGFSHDGGFELGRPIAPPAGQDDGPLRIRPSRRGPLLLDGVVEVRSADLETFARIQHPALCRCGHSGLKPFCDGTHLEIGFDRT